MKNLIIVGAGGLGLEVAAYAQDIARNGSLHLTLKGFLDDTRNPKETYEGFPILGATDSVLDPNAFYIIAVGTPEGREKLAATLTQQGARFINLLHPAAYIAEKAVLGTGIIAAPFAFVGAKATIADHCLLNIHSSVGHEATVGTCSVLSPYADLNGGAVAEDRVFLGAHACVMPRLCVGSHSKIAAGAVVYTDIPGEVTAIGNPAACRAVKEQSR